jgi:hypothetical protein
MSKYSSFKQQQLIAEGWRRFLNEEIDLIQKAKEIMSNNPFLSSLVDKVTNESLVDIGQNMLFLYIPNDTFEHAKKSHTVSAELPGSKFNENYINDESLLNLIKKVVQISPTPSQETVERGVKKLKWFNIELKNQVGLDSVVKKDDAYLINHQSKPYEYKEKIGNIKAIPAILSSGDVIVKDSNGNIITSENSKDIDQSGQTSYFIIQQLEVVDAPMKPTKKINLILAELGEIDNKKLVSLMTIFPGEAGADLMNKQDYIKAGYVFVTGKEPQSISENFRNYSTNQPLNAELASHMFARMIAEERSEYHGAHLDDGTLVCEACLQELLESDRLLIQEAKYQGRTVTLNKPMKGDVKKSKVYVRDPQTGNIKKVNFGDKNMKIKKNIPARRKSFRARHNCDNPGPKTKARYWSCKAW